MKQNILVTLGLLVSSAALAASPLELITKQVRPETFQQATQVLTGQLPLLPGSDAYVLDRWTKDGMAIARLYLHRTIVNMSGDHDPRPINRALIVKNH